MESICLNLLRIEEGGIGSNLIYFTGNETYTFAAMQSSEGEWRSHVYHDFKNEFGESYIVCIRRQEKYNFKVSNDSVAARDKKFPLVTLVDRSGLQCSIGPGEEMEFTFGCYLLMGNRIYFTCNK